jgi:hypothetical protein
VQALFTISCTLALENCLYVVLTNSPESVIIFMLELGSTTKGSKMNSDQITYVAGEFDYEISTDGVCSAECDGFTNGVCYRDCIDAFNS